jgi:transcription antitermination factor NusA-like protein
VRLAAHLTGWKIDIVEASEDGEKKVADSEEGAAAANEGADSASDSSLDEGQSEPGENK